MKGSRPWTSVAPALKAAFRAAFCMPVRNFSAVSPRRLSGVSRAADRACNRLMKRLLSGCRGVAEPCPPSPGRDSLLGTSPGSPWAVPASGADGGRAERVAGAASDG